MAVHLNTASSLKHKLGAELDNLPDGAHKTEILRLWVQVMPHLSASVMDGCKGTWVLRTDGHKWFCHECYGCDTPLKCSRSAVIEKKTLDKPEQLVNNKT